MTEDHKYRGIFFMLLASLGFSLMAASAKLLTGSFNAGQLVFYRNAIGVIVLTAGFLHRPPVRKIGGKIQWLMFRGLIGTIALYTLLFCILHMPLGTAMTYNVSSTLFIALFSFLFFGELHGKWFLFAVMLGFLGILLIYKPQMHIPVSYHLTGLFSAIASAIAYITVGKLAKFYDSRLIVFAFVISGFVIPGFFMVLHHVFGLSTNNFFVISWKWPQEKEWIYIFLLGLTALFGQYFVTLAYGSDKAGVVSAFGYANVIFSIILGVLLGDSFPDLISITGISCIILSGIIISLAKSWTSKNNL